MIKSTLQSNASDVVFESVSKRYGASVLAVDDISLHVQQGHLVTLLGPSGCGKTTTLRMIAGLEACNTGKVFIGNQDVTDLPASQRDVSMVFQSYALFPHMTVFENVSYGLIFSGFDKPQAQEKARAGLGLVGLEHLASRLPSQLSGGQQQRVAVARALVLEPQVLLFDEPLSNLDAKLRRSVREEIRDIQQSLGLTVVYVTHDQEEALAVSDEIIVMDKGRIAQFGTPRELYDEPASLFVADFIGESNIIDCQIKDVQEGQADVRLGGVRYLINGKGLAAGDAKLAIRPDRIALVLDEDKECLPGTITKASYVGSRMEYEVKTSAGDFFVVSMQTDHPARPSQPVWLRLEVGAMWLF